MAITHEEVRYLPESQDEKLFDDQRERSSMVDTPLAPGHQSVLYRRLSDSRNFPCKHICFSLWLNGLGRAYLCWMGKTGKKEGYTQKSVYPGITPQVASAGVQQALKVLEGRWKLTILFELFKGRTLRFSELERAIPGVSQKMLIQQLRDLERDGVVSRVVHPVVPPKVEYSLTSGGEELCPALDELLFWAQRWKGQPTSADSSNLRS
jgi:DNA-binding HxlR family transcriptional regulator